MDKLVADAMEKIKDRFGGDRISLEMPPKVKGDLHITYERTTSLAPYGPFNMCIPGMYGSDIIVSGIQMREVIYQDLQFFIFRQGFISPEDENLLRNIVGNWNADSEFAPWTPVPPSGHISVCNHRVSPGTAAMFEWKNDASEIPKSVLDLISALNRIIWRLSPNPI